MVAESTSPSSITRFAESLKQSRKYLARFRKNRYKHIEQYAGKHYSMNGARRPVPRNLIDKMVTVLSMELAAQNPKCLVLTDKRHLKGEAASREYVLNDEIQRMQLEKTIRHVVMDALFGIGIVKVGIAEYGKIEVDGNERVLTRPYAVAIDLDDWMHDMTATRWADVDYEGHKYRVPKEDIVGNDLYDQEVVEQFCDHAADYYPEDERGDPKVESISRSEFKSSQDDTYRDHLTLWDIYFPQEGILRTYLASGSQDECPIMFSEDESKLGAIREEVWEGPPAGPFHKLGYKWVPNNTMPKSPVGDIRDLHDAVNAITRKSIWQLVNAKNIFTYAGSAASDMDRLRRASDMETVRIDHPEAGKNHRIDGFNPGSLGAVSWLSGLANEHGGNFDLIGGYAPQSDTLGQDKLLHTGATKMVVNMQTTTSSVVRGIIEDIAFYLFTDPDLNRNVSKKLPRSGIEFSTQMTSEDVEGDHSDFKFEIEPFSMKMMSPQERIQGMRMLLQESMQLAQMGILDQQQITIDGKGYIDALVRLSGLEAEAADFLVSSEKPIVAEDRSHERSMPANTHRVHERRDTKGEGGSEADFQQKMLSMKPHSQGAPT